MPARLNRSDEHTSFAGADNCSTTPKIYPDFVRDIFSTLLKIRRVANSSAFDRWGYINSPPFLRRGDLLTESKVGVVEPMFPTEATCVNRQAPKGKPERVQQLNGTKK
jgi:hypothetical protein